MRAIAAAVLLVPYLAVTSFAGQQSLRAENPLAKLRDQVQRVLSAAHLPFTEEQESAIILMMEDRRKASEDLFGDLMNFSAGPTQGQQADRLQSAISWMENEFLAKLQDYLTEDQLAVWKRALEISPGMPDSAQQTPVVARNQTQYVRINNNPFTSEDGAYRFSRFARTSTPVQETEVIQRGGAGSWHGTAQFLLKDDALNAGRRFAKNKPPYQERQTSFDVSGPVISGKLSSRFAFLQNEAENVDTIRATLPDTIFSLGITRPARTRSFNFNNTYQLSDATALSLNGEYTSASNKNQGVGGFVMPDRAFGSDGKVWNLEIRQFSALSSQKIYETRLNLTGNRDETIPTTHEVQINVLDAFSTGGAQNDLRNTGGGIELSNLYSHLGERLTLKAGFSAMRTRNRSVSKNMFLGAFTFSSIENYKEGRPLMYRVNRGIPELDISQWETAIFAQNDFRITSRLTAMYGARYEMQTNIGDRNNLDGRIGFAYAPKRATVIRGGIGTFHQRVPMKHIENYTRRNGEQQYELIIDRPSYPDPFQSGATRPVSVRVINPDLVTPYNFVFLASYEQTFLEHLILSVAYDRNREVHRLRPRNLNAPLDLTSPNPASCKPGQSKETCVRPDPTRGNIISLESSASDITHNLRVSVRERFSIFNVIGNYTFNREWLDSVPANNLGVNVAGPSGYGPDGLNSDQYNLASDWALIVSPKHNIDTTVNARLPFGIFLTKTMNYRSHSKYTITTGSDDNSDTSVNDRPPALPRSTGKAHNSITFNFNISKAIFIGAANGGNGSTRSNINLFANMTNAFNRPNYAPPSGVMSSPNFGKSTSAGEPRKIEVGLRFQF